MIVNSFVNYLRDVTLVRALDLLLHLTIGLRTFVVASRVLAPFTCFWPCRQLYPSSDGAPREAELGSSFKSAASPSWRSSIGGEQTIPT
ncbi:hypothetical protein HPP92_003466 [Vanilla planifolia]|uniref:Uncharacterized protein n=1 Tax=Vanilla planifolia TaxID=51239 RepID=A0A835VJX7_VANPL|nr:hypothetical protein HPP92_003466 [Vanilla planifolia]